MREFAVLLLCCMTIDFQLLRSTWGEQNVIKTVFFPSIEA